MFTDEAQPDQPNTRKSAKAFFEGRLNRGTLMALPSWGILRSNVTKDDASPAFEAVLFPDISREELWLELREKHLAGTTFRFFVDRESYDAHVAGCDDALLRHLITRKKITTRSNRIWKIRRHNKSDMPEKGSETDTFDVWSAKPRSLLAANVTKTSLHGMLDRLIGEHGRLDLIKCHDSYALDNRDFMRWALYRDVDLVFVP